MFGIFKKLTTGESLLMQRYPNYAEAFKAVFHLKQCYNCKMEIVRIGGTAER